MQENLFLHLLAQLFQALFTEVADGHYRFFTLFEQLQYITNRRDACPFERVENPHRRSRSQSASRLLTGQAAASHLFFTGNSQRFVTDPGHIAQVIDQDA